MPYQKISEIPIGAIVWVEFLPDLDGIADEQKAAEVLGKSRLRVRCSLRRQGSVRARLASQSAAAVS